MPIHPLPDSASALRLLAEIAGQQVVHTPRSIDKPLALYGAGNLGKLAKAYFDRLGIQVHYVVDAKPETSRLDPFWQGIPLLTPAEASDEQKKNVLLVVTVGNFPYSELQATLLSKGWVDVVSFYDVTETYRQHHPFSNGWAKSGLTSLEKEKIAQVLPRWSDDLSRAHHLQFVAWRCLHQDWIFTDAPVTTDDRYFIQPVTSRLTRQEVILDVGAHQGEFLEQCLKRVGDFQALWAIEPDPDNIQLMEGVIARQPVSVRGKIYVLKRAVGATIGQGRFFAGLGYASQFCEIGAQELDWTTLDHLCLNPTFLKLHLEGWELNALQGAIETIQRCRPIIAATSYHNELGLWELPAWMLDHLPDYRCLMRLHSWLGNGAVVYAIPCERGEVTRS